ncbi:hypothetical protein IQ264_00280 [Phormidium sp. LEGE 05292]|uniref:hypothetical protein n=1 Tax=[Phormidium] sp. LEGE 05292 TaxID=767427 RepID=UPI00187ECE9E|nr:hypothetical protein [Phormidium sp. LEGE 05292]MBE9223914.1 hypothetical protein [Phormidium sp. LEGE 05292]
MNQNSLPIKTEYKDSAIVSFFLSLLIVLVFIQTSDQFLHWFLFPVTLCGILIGIDAVDWFRGRLGIFDPVGIIGLLGFHFFFLAPLFHVSWDFWMGGDATPPPDWRPWIGWMAILNFLGLWIYRLSRNIVFQPKENPAKQTVWQLNRRRFIPILCFGLMLSAVLQLLVYQKFGGITNYIEAATRAARREGEGEFAGSGIIFLFSESFPILAMMGFAAYAQKNQKMRSWTVLVIVLLVFIVLQMLFGGLRGSRSNTIWALFWAVGIINFWIRSITKKQIAIGLVFMVFFMYLYGFFKTGGLEGVSTALEGQEARATLEKKSGRSWQGLVLQDLGRSDVQAFLLYRLMQPTSDYKYAWGHTYYSALSMLVPSVFWPNKPPDKIKEGTEAQYGMGTYHPQLWASSKVYGLAGETMLNFGPMVIPFAFIFLGVVVGNVRRLLFTLSPADNRLILLPFLVNYCFVILVGDLDNQIYFLMKNGGFPFIVMLLSTDKIIVSKSQKENYLSTDSAKTMKLKGK